MNLRIGRVVGVHPEDNSVDLVMIDDGARIAGAQVMAGCASLNSGTSDLPSVKPAGDKWKVGGEVDRDVIAVVSTVGPIALVLGFLFPQVCQMLFKEANRRVVRHASDVYTTVDDAGNTELYHPSGTFLRIGTSPDHEDLTGKDFDKKWKIGRNTGAAVSVRLQVANAGAVRATLTIDPSGNVTLTNSGDLTVSTSGKVAVSAGGTMDLTSGGTMTLTAPRINLN